MSAINSVPDGFKQSDVGIIPKTWDLKQFGECFNIIAGLGFAKSEYTQSGLNLLRIDNVSYGKVIWDSIAYLPENYVNKYPHLILEAGDLLLALNRPITNGKLKLAKLTPHDLPSILYQRVGKISTSDKNIDLNFAFYLLTKFIKLFVEESAVGTDQPFISTTKLKKCDLPIPPKSEQTAIANALFDVDALLTELEKLIAKKQAIKTATMQQLLTGKTRLPQFATYNEGEKQGQSKGTKPCELGEIPEDWDVSPLGDLVSIQSGESPSKFQFISDGIPYFKVEQLNNGLVYAEETEYRVDTKKVVDAGSIIFPKRGASILLNKIRVLKNDSFMDTNLMTLTCNDKLNNLFLHNILTYKGLDQVADTTSIPQINNKHIIPFLIAAPNIEEQTAIATILSDMDNEIQTLEQRLAKTRQIKQGMMQELLTGRTRLPFDKE